MSLNRIVSPLTLPETVEYLRLAATQPGTIANPVFGLCRGLPSVRNSTIVPPESESLRHLSLSLELYLRRLISHCARSVSLPYSYEKGWLNSNQLKSLLVPTAQKTVRFVDRRGHIWDAVRRYLLPATESLRLQDHKAQKSLSAIAWYFYLLILASKARAEVHIPLGRVLDWLTEVERSPTLRREASLRLAVIHGIFATFAKPVDAPSLALLRPARGLLLSQRLSEILDDAYFLEASQLRRFLGIGSNVAAVKRDLKAVLLFITRHRKWARGILSLGSSSLIGGQASARALDRLLEALPELEAGMDYPVILINHLFPLDSSPKGGGVLYEIVRDLTGQNKIAIYLGSRDAQEMTPNPT